MNLNDIKEYTLDAFEDYRGEIYTIYTHNMYPIVFNHDKICMRYKNTLTGIHGDFIMWKLITCLYGSIYSIFVDNRKESIDYLKHKSFMMSGTNKKQLLIPPGIGNSFLVLSDICVYNYKLSYIDKYIDDNEQFTLRWNDPILNIVWPISNPIISERDAKATLIR